MSLERPHNADSPKIKELRTSHEALKGTLDLSIDLVRKKLKEIQEKQVIIIIFFFERFFFCCFIS